MTPQDLAAALHAAGFVGVAGGADLLFARADPSAAEFQARPDGAGWTLTFAHPVRAPAAEILAWNIRHPHAPLDLSQGETRISMRLGQASDLAQWRSLLTCMTGQSRVWRRAQRQGDEGM